MSAKPALGLYFTDRYIEISQLSSDGSKLLKFNTLPLPPETVENGEIKNPAVLTSTLTKLMMTAKPGPISVGEEVVIGVGDNKIFLREFSLPKFPGKKVEDAIEWQVKSLMPVLPIGVETDWQIIGRSEDGQVEVLLTAIPKNIIDQYLTAVTAVGLSVVAIEPAVFADIRVLKQDIFKGKDQLLVFVGDTFAEFSYITNGNPRFSDLMSFDEIKKKGDIVKVIEDYVNYANGKHPERKVTEIVVAGYNQAVMPIVENLKFRKYIALEGVSRVSTSVKELLVRTSHGLALKTTEKMTTTNLLPVDFRLDVVKRNLMSKWKFVLDVLAILTFLSGFAFYYLYTQAKSREANLMTLRDSYQQEINSPENKDLIVQAGEVNRMTDELVIIKEAVGGEDNLLRRLAAVTPNGVTLTSLVYSRGAGAKTFADPKSLWAVTGTADSRDVVLNLYNKLVAQPGFENGRLFFGSLEREASISFRIASTQMK